MKHKTLTNILGTVFWASTVLLAMLGGFLLVDGVGGVIERNHRFDTAYSVTWEASGYYGEGDIPRQERRNIVNYLCVDGKIDKDRLPEAAARSAEALELKDSELSGHTEAIWIATLAYYEASSDGDPCNN